MRKLASRSMAQTVRHRSAIQEVEVRFKANSCVIRFRKRSIKGNIFQYLFFSATIITSKHHTPSSVHSTTIDRATSSVFNPQPPNDLYICRTAELTSRCCIVFIYSTNIRTEYFKHAAHSPFFPLKNAVYFIMLPFLVLVLFTF